MTCDGNGVRGGLWDNLRVGLRGGVAASIIAVLLAPQAGGQTDWCMLYESAKLAPRGLGVNAMFGASIAASGDWAIVGAPHDHDDSAPGGGAYILRRTDGVWQTDTKLHPDELTDADQFGTAVAIDGDVAVVGTPYEDENGSKSGAAWVYRRVDGAWAFEAKLTAPGIGREFGASVAVQGETVFVGATQLAASGVFMGVQPGAVYVYSHVGLNWVFQQKLASSDGVDGDMFGAAIAADGDHLLIGAPGVDADENNADSGAAYLFTHGASGWTQTQRIDPPDPHDGNKFAVPIAMDGPWCAIGEPRIGKAHMYGVDDRGLTPAQALTLAPGLVWSESSSQFGGAISIQGDRMVIGAPKAKRFAESPPISDVQSVGTACCFELSGATWQFSRYLSETVNQAGGDLGTAVALAGEDVLTGRVRLYAQGTTLVFSLNAPDCDRNGVPDPCDADCNRNRLADDCELASGARPDCDGNGLPDECDSPFAYQVDMDDLAYSFTTSAPGGYDLIWLNQFRVTPGHQVLTALAIAWGFHFPSFKPVHLLVYDDPNDDGDPSDAVLLASVETLSQDFGVSSFIPTFARVPIPPTHVGAVGHSFFIGGEASGVNGSFPGTVDNWGTHDDQRSWYSINAYGQADIRSLADNEPFHAAPGHFVLRAVADDCNQNGVMDSCDIASGFSRDANGNGVPDECETASCPGDVAGGPLGGDGTVDVADLFLIIDSWGSQIPGAPDINHDGAVNVDDLFAVINAWGACP